MKNGEVVKRSALMPSRIRFCQASGLIHGVEHRPRQWVLDQLGASTGEDTAPTKAA